MAQIMRALELGCVRSSQKISGEMALKPLQAVLLNYSRKQFQFKIKVQCRTSVEDIGIATSGGEIAPRHNILKGQNKFI